MGLTAGIQQEQNTLHMPLNRVGQISADTLPLIGDLRQDHLLLRGELTVLEKAENGDISCLWQTLRDVCTRLSSRLSEHIHREGRLVVVYSRYLGAFRSEKMARLSIDHYNEYRYLQVITDCLVREDRDYLQRSRHQLLANFLSELNHHMDVQESKLFPLIEQIRNTSLDPLLGVDDGHPLLGRGRSMARGPHERKSR